MSDDSTKIRSKILDPDKHPHDFALKLTVADEKSGVGTVLYFTPEQVAILGDLADDVLKHYDDDFELIKQSVEDEPDAWGFQ